MTHKQLGFLGIDQHGKHYNMEVHPRKELLEQLGYAKAGKMYRDTKDGKTRHVGYVIGPYWVEVFRVCQWHGEDEA